ncbi:unnamed protein product [Ceratitis capitata]|uniref:(Mediterranean fruit fly) hypothetical protein n=1 Tax=Ceratitis capitata TaxID=7213 RepID=A0A811V8Q4_CERCA|nr:unnamed protein product [Ceratitis capitata]
MCIEFRSRTKPASVALRSAAQQSTLADNTLPTNSERILRIYICIYMIVCMCIRAYFLFADICTYACSYIQRYNNNNLPKYADSNDVDSAVAARKLLSLRTVINNHNNVAREGLPDGLNTYFVLSISWRWIFANIWHLFELC